MPKVSVIVPCYKVEKYLPECIDSIVSQTLEDIEIILIDDGSPDLSGLICDQAAEKDIRIKVIHKDNGGVSAARNDGLEIAEGKYVIFIDSDDYMTTDALQVLYTRAEEVRADVVVGDIYRAYNEEKRYVHFYEKEFTTSDRAEIDKLIQADFYNQYCPYPYNNTPAFGYGGPWNKLIRREMISLNDIKFDVRVQGLFDDIIFSAYVLACANTVTYISVPVYVYRVLTNSITRTYKRNLLEINSAIFNSWDEFLEKFDKKHIYTEAYYANVIRRFDDCLNRYFFSKENNKSFKEIANELSRLMCSEPYKSVPRHVNFSKLTTRHKMLAKQLNSGSAIMVMLIYQLSAFRKKLNNKITVNIDSRVSQE